MAITTRYLTSTKKIDDFLSAIKNAEPPKKFTMKYLEDLGFKTAADRLYVGMLKALGMLDDSGVPTDRYYEFMDESLSGQVLAAGMREAYEDLFQVNKTAYKLTQADVKSKLRTLTKSEHSDDVLAKMAKTFTEFAKHADFEVVTVPPAEDHEDELDESVQPPAKPADLGSVVDLGGLVYTIELRLPETRDPKVYEALFRALKEHLLS